MTPERWRQVTRVYGAVMTKPPDVRAAALLELCPDDEALRKEVESLLADDSGAALLDRPIGDVATSVVQQNLSGRTLGPYRLDAPIGAGGMGQVYRAHDTRLNRTVAIKVLVAALAHDPQFRARFDREAKAIAALNHPHICTLHDIGSAEGIDYLVMEYVEGEALSDRLDRGALPFEQALATAIQIADALAAAHRQGIVHRDLKPGNVMLTKAGVKLLDFGLAKPSSGPTVAGPLSMLPTTPPIGPTRGAPLTMQGTILGTLQYMAPEQLEGKEADARTDIFAFGAIVYEMVTGKKAFSGASQASLIGAIMHAEPPSIIAGQPLAPAALDRLVRTCLEKDREKRWQNAGDVATQLTWLGKADTGDSVSVSKPRSNARLALALTAAVLLGVGLTWAVMTLRSTVIVKPSVVSFTIEAPGSGWGSNPAGTVPLAASPDGRWIVCAVRATSGSAQALWLRSLDAPAMKQLPGTDAARLPFWSPDSKTVGFLTQTEMRKVDIDGGAAQKIADVDNGSGATWATDGTILVATVAGGLFRTTERGGALVSVTLDHLPGAPRFPRFFDNQRFVLTTLPADPNAPRAVYLADLNSLKATLLVDNAQYAQFAGEDLLYVRGQTLFAQPFDARSGQLRDRPTRIAEPVGISSNGNASYAVSPSVLVYAGDPTAARRISWADADGRMGDPILTVTSGGSLAMDLSPDGKRLVTTRIDPATGAQWLWITDTERHTDKRIGPGNNAIFSPDGQSILSASPPPLGLQLIDLNAGTPKAVLPSPAWPTDWSRDGRMAIVERPTAKTQFDLFAIDVQSGQLRPLVETAGDDGQGRLSPDRRWLAYSSNESGQAEVYVRPFERPGETIPISSSGGSQPRWAADGHTLFFLSSSHVVTAVSVDTADDKLRVGATRSLFSLNVPFSDPLFGSDYFPTKDGRFIVNSLAGERSSRDLTVQVNWNSALKP